MTTTDRLTDAPLLVTLPRVLKSEAEPLAALSRAGAGQNHIRTPESSAAEVEGLLRDLCAAGADMDCFTLHYDEPLARRYGVGGVLLRGERIAAGEPLATVDFGKVAAAGHSDVVVVTVVNAAELTVVTPLIGDGSGDNNGGDCKTVSAGSPIIDVEQ